MEHIIIPNARESHLIDCCCTIVQKICNCTYIHFLLIVMLSSRVTDS